MRIRHLIAFLLVVGLGATGAMAANWTVYPTAETNSTGYTDFEVKTDGEVLVYGGANTGTVRMASGYFKFDLTTIPDVTVPTTVTFNFYVNATYFPYWSVTPVTLDPVAIGSTAPLLWDDIQAEKLAGYYNYQNEGSTYAVGWKTLELGGTAVADVTTALATDWFALGAADRDTTNTYYLEIDGATDLNIPYLVVDDSPIYNPPSDVTCAENGLDVDLTWVNNGAYDSIEIYEDTILVGTSLGTDTSFTVPNVTAGYHCYQVCGLSGVTPYCSADCCLVFGSCDDVLIDLGTMACADTITYSGDTTGATDYCEDLNGDHHFSVEMLEAGTYTFSLCDTTWDTRLYVYDDSCCGTQIGYDDDDCDGPGSGLASVITLDLEAGVYYILVGGYSANEGAYDLAITCEPPPPIPSDFTCTESGGDVILTWVNEGAYSNIRILEGTTLIEIIDGASETYTITDVEKGYHCYNICAFIGLTSYCTDICCLVIGYDDSALLWDFEADDGGFVTDGTTGWQWGAPTFGPCAATADGNVWGVNLDGEYGPSECLVLDSSVTIEMGTKGGFICMDHCYDTESGFDGGVVWFTTNGGGDYFTAAPIEGYDDLISSTFDPADCPWVYGNTGFTGDSLGWVNDCWDLTDPAYNDSTIGLKFAMGTDGTVFGSGWMIDNIWVYRNFGSDDTFDCAYTVAPLSGTLPFVTNHQVTLTNILSGGAVLTRRIAGRITLRLGNGNFYNPWRTGFTNLAPGASYTTGWNTNLLALAPVVGTNTFQLLSEDVTPAPYNQPPNPPSGQTCTATNLVVATAP